jgi:hypothetical protein
MALLCGPTYEMQSPVFSRSPRNGLSQRFHKSMPSPSDKMSTAMFLQIGGKLEGDFTQPLGILSDCHSVRCSCLICGQRR